MRILVIEDQSDLNEIITRKLKNENYIVDSCLTGEEGLVFLEDYNYDAVITDIMLPGITGIGILKKLRGNGNLTPVLLLTALGTVEDRVAGLDAGADDYLVKPFDFNELMARIRAMTRRGQRVSSNILNVKDLVMDLTAMTVKRNDKSITLTSREFSLLEYMIKNKGMVLSRDRLLNHIWSYDYDGGSNVVDVFIHHLRKKIDGGFDEKIIETVKGTGYIIR